jgi:hypothetical protein
MIFQMEKMSVYNASLVIAVVVVVLVLGSLSVIWDRHRNEEGDLHGLGIK